MAEDTETTTTEDAAPAATVEVRAPERPAELGDAGKRALEEERKGRKVAEDAAKAETKARKALEQELDKLRKQQMGETEKALADAKDSGRAEATSEFGRRLAAAEFRAAAANADRDAGDLLELIDFSRFVGADGEPDSAAIAAAVDKLPVRKPDGPPAPPVPPSFDGGPRLTPTAANLTPRERMRAQFEQDIRASTRAT